MRHDGGFCSSASSSRGADRFRNQPSSPPCEKPPKTLAERGLGRVRTLCLMDLSSGLSMMPWGTWRCQWTWIGDDSVPDLRQAHKWSDEGTRQPALENGLRADCQRQDGVDRRVLWTSPRLAPRSELLWKPRPEGI